MHGKGHLSGGLGPRLGRKSPERPEARKIRLRTHPATTTPRAERAETRPRVPPKTRESAPWMPPFSSVFFALFTAPNGKLPFR